MGLTHEQIVDFQTNGYLIAEDVLTDAELQPVIDEINQIIDERARRLKSEGKITELYENEPFERRIILLSEQSKEITKNLDIMFTLGEAMFDFLRNDRLLNVVESLLGREISCNPIQHMRAKLPWRGVGEQPADENVPWHQDAAVTSEDSEASEIITFWMPLVDATAETGCMEIMPQVFKQGYLKHIGGEGTTISPELLPSAKPITAECRKGSIVIMNKYTPHRGTSNLSNIVRWSLDLRYHKTGAASGRSYHPSFVVRSASNPDSVLTDHNQWRTMWKEAIEKKQNYAHRV
ncbi:phytanoyl-CoA dioxygenase family protein [Paenibacillus abyssi]|uniref:Phytanoyl-CoA dioxygenase n=1 Tax=Paenibacillus abyssi TaxID=1340531 RepID=A0A917G1Z2_9BACL|nr:phytanoyl-CoA dioxygenase family protein [Paenibacillus abyssi]GGG18887.1 phytanoyl-CoA dioxygenase [Paenibacillus abyssi]